MTGLGRVQSTKKYENQISRTGRRIVVKPVFDSDSPSPDFRRLFLKKWEKNAAAIFPIMLRKKVVKELKVMSGRKNLVATHTGFATFTAFFPGILEKCQFLIALPSVDGSKNVTRLIMVQGILSQPMIMLSAGCGELTLGAE